MSGLPGSSVGPTWMGKAGVDIFAVLKSPTLGSTQSSKARLPMAYTVTHTDRTTTQKLAGKLEVGPDVAFRPGHIGRFNGAKPFRVPIADIERLWLDQRHLYMRLRGESVVIAFMLWPSPELAGVVAALGF